MVISHIQSLLTCKMFIHNIVTLESLHMDECRLLHSMDQQLLTRHVDPPARIAAGKESEKQC